MPEWGIRSACTYASSRAGWACELKKLKARKALHEKARKKTHDWAESAKPAWSRSMAATSSSDCSSADHLGVGWGVGR